MVVGAGAGYFVLYSGLAAALETTLNPRIRMHYTPKWRQNDVIDR